MIDIGYDAESGEEIIHKGAKWDTLHIHGFPSDIVPAVHKYNCEHTGPNGDAINITLVCINALRTELEKRGILNVE